MKKHGGKPALRKKGDVSSPWFAKSVRERRVRNKIAKMSRRRNRPS